MNSLDKSRLDEHCKQLERDFPDCKAIHFYDVDNLYYKTCVAKEMAGGRFRVERCFRDEDELPDLEGDICRYHALLDDLSKTACLFKRTETQFWSSD